MEKEKFEVLLVDDDEMTIFFHEVYVKENDFHPNPKCFYNGKDVFDYFNTYFNIGKHYLILMDINMPILDCWDVMDEIIKNGMDKNVSVVLLTSSLNAADKMKAKSYAMVIDYLEKPLSIENLEHIKALDQIKPYF